jgi:hypothetical protein
MDEGLLKLMKEYLPEWIITFSVVVLVILFLFKKVRETVANIKLPAILSRRKITIKHLTNHQFFVFIDYMDKYKIDRMEFGDPGRTKIFREYFKIRCKTFHDQTKVLVSEDILMLSPTEVKCKIFNTLYDSIKETNKQMLDQCSNDEERFVVNFIIDKFADHADSSIEAFKEVIETIFDSGFAYENNFDRLNAMLNVFLFAFVATFAETEKVLHKINGDVTGKTYKGIKLV